MAYGTNPLVVRQQIAVATQSARLSGRHVYAGLGIYNIGADRQTLTTMIEDSRELGAQGFSLFSYQSIVGDLNTFLMVREMFRTRRASRRPGDAVEAVAPGLTREGVTPAGASTRGRSPPQDRIGSRTKGAP